MSSSVAGVVVEAALTHRVVADGAVADHPADVRTLGQAPHRAEVLAVGDPVPGQTAEDGVAGDVLDALHQLGQVGAVLGAAGRERDAAVAHDHAGHAVPAARRADRIPRQLGVEVGVDVDEAGGHDPAVGLDLAVSPAAQLRLDGHDTVTDDAHVRDARRRPRTVDDGAVPDDQIHVHKPSPRCRAWCIGACLSIGRPAPPGESDHLSHRCNRVRAGRHHPHAVRRPILPLPSSEAGAPPCRR